MTAIITSSIRPNANHLWIPPKIKDELRSDQRKLEAEGSFPSRRQLQRYHDTFRRQFGPEVLRGLDGDALLERMHAHGRRDSLVYWLEFKNDDEFPEIFGSIGGGNALKFGVFRRAETGAWVGKGSGGSPQDIPVEQAIEIARTHRDQLLAAVDAIGNLPSSATDADYVDLQNVLQRVAPAVEDTAWGHKYLSLIFPDVLDNFHAERFQRYQLVRLLQLPPHDVSGFLSGRYVCAGRFVAAAAELDVPLGAATILLNRRHGRPKQYWRIGTTDDEKARRKFWPMMRDSSTVAIGWEALGDLSAQAQGTDPRTQIAALLERHYPNARQATSRAAGQILKFLSGFEIGDRVLAADGMTVLGVGEIAGPYQFVPGTPFPHTRPVKWLSRDEWKSVDAESLRTTVGTIKDYRNQVEAERHILDTGSAVMASIAPQHSSAQSSAPQAVPHAITAPRAARGPVARLTGIPGAVQSVLERKGQAILYGPPGTGKTYWALRTARDLSAMRAFGVRFDQTDEVQRARVLGNGAQAEALVRMCSFHPEYGYEDFIEGFRPRVGPSGELGFALTPGIFRQLCTDAARSPELDFYLIVDEINRGDIPRIFGELLTLLERDKRDEPVRLGVSGEEFRVPSNVFVVGTMNTADRSIALLDVALRRRFGFVELMPDYNVLGNTAVAELSLGAWLADLNRRIRDTGGGDARNRQIGHAFLLDRGVPITSVDQFSAVLRDDIVPLLEEYTYDDFGQLSTLLGKSLVDVEGQRVRRELFEPGRSTDLVSALNNPDLATTTAAIMAQAGVGIDNLETDEDDGPVVEVDDPEPSSEVRVGEF